MSNTRLVGPQGDNRGALEESQPIYIDEQTQKAVTDQKSVATR